MLGAEQICAEQMNGWMNAPSFTLKTQNKSDLSFVCQSFQYFEPEISSLMGGSFINCYFVFGRVRGQDS